MCSIAPKTANVGSSYNRMRGPGIGYWFSDRSNCSHWSLTLTFTLTSDNLSLYIALLLRLVLIQLCSPRCWHLDCNYCRTRCRQWNIFYDAFTFLSLKCLNISPDVIQYSYMQNEELTLKPQRQGPLNLTNASIFHYGCIGKPIVKIKRSSYLQNGNSCNDKAAYIESVLRWYGKVPWSCMKLYLYPNHPWHYIYLWKHNPQDTELSH